MKRTTKTLSTVRLERRILDAALACFLENGIEGTTIEHIRAASGASNGSIYHHFGSKGAIALALYVEGMQRYQTEILAQLQHETDAEGGIRAIVVGHLKWVEANPELGLFLSRAGMTEVSGPIATRIAEVNAEFFRVVHEWLRPFIDRGDVIRLRPALYAPLIVGPAAHVARHWLAHRLSVDLSEVAEVLAAAAWRALKAG